MHIYIGGPIEQHSDYCLEHTGKEKTDIQMANVKNM